MEIYGAKPERWRIAPLMFNLTKCIMSNRKSQWMYVVVLNRTPLAIYTKAYYALAFLTACLRADVVNCAKCKPSDYKVWRERYFLDDVLDFQREDLTERMLYLAQKPMPSNNSSDDNDKLPF